MRLMVGSKEKICLTSSETVNFCFVFLDSFLPNEERENINKYLYNVSRFWFHDVDDDGGDGDVTSSRAHRFQPHKSSSLSSV